MKISPSKLVLPVILIVTGIALLYLSFSTGQNSEFNIASASIGITGILYLLYVMNIIGKPLQLIMTVILVLGSFVLGALDFKSIKDPVDFMNVKSKRDKFIIQKLKDIRTAEIAYKVVNGSYTNNYDTLIHFIKNGSFAVVKAIGTVPDSLTEEQALLQGIVKRDTTYVPIQDSLFSIYNLKGHIGKFHLDSIAYIPFSNGKKFLLEAGEIDRNNVKVKVFQATAPIELVYSEWDKRFYDKEKSLTVGSMSDPSTSGNWGE